MLSPLDARNYYVVVEPATIADRWNQGIVTSRGCLNARFGDSNTPSGTGFRVYVVASNEEIPVGLMGAPLPVGQARFSECVGVVGIEMIHRCQS